MLNRVNFFSGVDGLFFFALYTKLGFVLREMNLDGKRGKTRKIKTVSVGAENLPI